MCEALEVLAEKGYVHRDVKPMNIIQRTASEYVLIDAGLALDRDADSITIPGAVVGTRAYLSPDQLTLPQKVLDIRSDLFSFGVTLYESATGEHPFMNDEAPRGEVIHNILNFDCVHPQHFNPLVPRPLFIIILKLLRKDRGERYQCAGDLRDALEAALSE